MAAGMGSRFGGLKQIEPLGPNGEFIIDYSIFNAIKTGFSKVIFIIKEENYEIFKETIGKRVEKYIPTEYVFQKIDNIPSFVNVPKERVKPWGTGHAILSAKDVITEPFMVINSDDFYGMDAFLKAKEFLKQHPNDYATIAYEAINTITENGSVKRGIINKDNDNNLVSLMESKLTVNNDKIYCEPLNGDNPFTIENNTLVSMNMLLLNPDFFKYLETKIELFFKNNIDKLDNCEFYITDVLEAAIKEKHLNIKVIPTNSKWYGVTYKDDAPIVKDALEKMHKSGQYPNKLWENKE